MTKSFAHHIIRQLEQDYDRIAPQFSNTRSQAWPEFASLKTLIKTNNTELLDIGCGNGRLAEAIPAVHYIGLDLSSQLLAIAQSRYPQYTFVHGSVLNLPFSDKQFDIVVCVATLQHVPSNRYRQAALEEMARVLKLSGYLFMLNWNLADQPQYRHYQVGNEYDEGDYLIPWKNDRGKVLAQRYYHGFGIAELVELAEITKLKLVKNELGQSRRNIVTILQK